METLDCLDKNSSTINIINNQNSIKLDIAKLFHIQQKKIIIINYLFVHFIYLITQSQNI